MHYSWSSSLFPFDGSSVRNYSGRGHSSFSDFATLSSELEPYVNLITICYLKKWVCHEHCSCSVIYHYISSIVYIYFSGIHISCLQCISSQALAFSSRHNYDGELCLFRSAGVIGHNTRMRCSSRRCSRRHNFIWFQQGLIVLYMWQGQISVVSDDLNSLHWIKQFSWPIQNSMLYHIVNTILHDSSRSSHVRKFNQSVAFSIWILW